MDYKDIRAAMVQDQLVRRGITDKSVLAAFLKVQRHDFVPDNLKKDAYEDFPLPIGEKQTISQPYIAALMSEALEVRATDKVLEIGTGSGYQTAILLELTTDVYSMERLRALADRARENLTKSGYLPIRIRVGDGTFGWPEEAPFDRILIAAAVKQTPASLIEQLKEGGKMIIPLGETFSQMLTLIEKKNNQINSTNICGCVFVPLVSKHNKGAEN